MIKSREINNITIRHDIKPGDMGYLIYLHGLLYARENGYDIEFEGYVANTFYEFSQLYKKHSSRLWIAQDGNRIIGSIAVIGRSAQEAQLRWFLIDPDYRGLGLGKVLLRKAMDFCKISGYTKIYLLTVSEQKTAIKLYEDIGFKKVEEKSSKMWGKDRINELKYELILNY
ncbi:MAG: GNAT family N-acetyltransferase [Mahellales bacterium]|jgi:GNAT superfamily N-acetyltransferase